MHHHRLVMTGFAISVATILSSPAAFAGTSQAAAGAFAAPPTASAALATVSSPALKSFTSASSGILHHGSPNAAISPRTVSGTTIYVLMAGSCDTETGDGTQASPYCSLQDGVSAASVGDTVSVAGNNFDHNFSHPGSVTVKTSGISIVGVGTDTVLFGQPALIFNDVSNVTVSHLNFQTSSISTSDVQVIGSTGITLDSDALHAQYGVPVGSVSIDGTSSAITVSRTAFVTDGWSSNVVGVVAASGASDVTIASDLFGAFGSGSVQATGVNGLNITGNTMERSCAAAIAVLGSSTGVYAENNLIEDVQLTSGFADCTKFSLGWDADIKISPQSAANTTTDYNDFYTQSSDTTAPYNWNGTVYPTLAAFQTATAQGAHDLNDPVEPLPVTVGPFVNSVRARLEVGAAAIGSANTHAPGALPTDLGGNSPYIDRGALAFVDDHLTAALTVTDTSALSVRADATASKGDQPIQQCYYDWGDGSSTASFDAIAAHSYARPGRYTVTVTVTDQHEEYVSTSVLATTAGSDYTAYGPVRILDTRKGIGTGGTVAKVGAGSVLKLQVIGAGLQGDTIPSGITAVVLNLTVTNAASGGYLTAYPNEDPSGALQSRPASSNVNFSAGQTVPNLAIVPVGRDGIVDLFNGSAGGTDMVADVTGYFTQSPAGGYTSLAPDRLVDTRKGVGAAKAQVPGNGSVSVQIAGADGGMLQAGASAVALNVTTVNAKAGGYLTLYPDGGARPTASNLNFGAGRVIANAVIVPVGSDGKIDLYNGSAGGTDVVVDVIGYYSSTGASAYLPIAPVRVLDTRTAGAGPLQPNGYVILYSQASVNGSSITSFVLNTTVTNTKAPGYETVAPDPNTLSAYQSGTEVFPTPPTVSTLNWSQGQVVPNLVQASTGQNGIVDVWNRSGGTVDFVVDQFGYYQAG